MEPQPTPPNPPAATDWRAETMAWRAEAASWRAKAEQLRAAVDRLRSLAAAGEAAGFLAHELNNLFTPVAGYCQAASVAGASDELRAKALRKALVATERVGELSRVILGLAGSASARPGGGEEGSGACEATEGISAALLVLGVERWRKDGIEVRVDVARGTSAAAPACVVQQVVMNLVLNARRAMEGRRGVIDVECGVVGGRVRVEVRDRGRGMAQEVMNSAGIITICDDTEEGSPRLRAAGGPVVTGGCDASGARVRGGSPSGPDGGPEGSGAGAAPGRHEVDVQELARSGSINGQARWGVRVRGERAGARCAGNDAQIGEEAKRKLARLRGGKIAASASPIKVWDAEEVARELRSAGDGVRVERGAGQDGRVQDRGGRAGAVGGKATKVEGTRGETAGEVRLSGASLPTSRGSAARDSVGSGSAEASGLSSAPHAESGTQDALAEPRAFLADASGSNDARGSRMPHALGGAGLGLALCVELVTRFGGRMSARSVAGEGTAVVVELPAARSAGKRAA